MLEKIHRRQEYNFHIVRVIFVLWIMMHICTCAKVKFEFEFIENTLTYG